MTWLSPTLAKLLSMFFPDKRLAIGLTASILIAALIAQIQPQIAPLLLLTGTIATFAWATKKQAKELYKT